MKVFELTEVRHDYVKNYLDRKIHKMMCPDMKKLNKIGYMIGSSEDKSKDRRLGLTISKCVEGGKVQCKPKETVDHIVKNLRLKIYNS